MPQQQYRVESKENVNYSGKRTKFHLYQRRGEAYVHVGAFTAPGWDQSDEQCIAAALETLAQDDEA